MTFHADQRMRHQTLAEQAFRSGLLGEAVFHTAKAAEYSLLLAEKAGGQVARAYLTDATELLDFAETIKKRTRQALPARPERNRNAQAPADDTNEWQLTERPDIRLSDVAGLDDVKKALRDNVIWPRQHPERYERYNVAPQAGVLMYGPPGNGKTYIAKAVAGELDAALFVVNAAAIKSKWVGKSEKNVKRLFEAAAKQERAIIFIDECDAILAAHQNEKVNIYTQFLTELDGIATRRDALYSRFILAATNKPWLLGDAVLRPGRIGQHVYVGLPDQASREAIMRRCLANIPAEADLPFDRLAGNLEGYSGADIAWACERAKRRAMEREIVSGNEDRVTLDDIDRVVEETPKSVSLDDLAQFHDWAEQRSRKD